ncbi:hypothetical protein [Tenacibaculum sp.]|uniref:hypothetical protein n=1 Tax=Tenacibaculum sp. TaxID=1906242 RepID=UPI003AA944D8
MKRLRNTAIYYIIFGALLAASFFFFKLWPISILGLLLLLAYLVLRFGFKKKNIKNNLTKQQLILWDAFLILFPFIYVIVFSWFVWRPYKQAIVLPKNYEGIVAVQYNKPDGQPKEWTGGFLGIGASRLIKVDSTGMAKSQFTYHNNAVPFLGAQQHSSPKGLKIYYEDDLDNEIIKDANGVSFTYENKDKNKPSIYFIEYRFTYKPTVIFVITKKENYHYYFMNEKEKEKWRKAKQKKSNYYIDELPHRLKQTFKDNRDLYNIYN